MIAGFLNLKSKRLPACKTFLCALHEHASLGGILNLEFVSLPFHIYGRETFNVGTGSEIPHSAKASSA